MARLDVDLRFAIIRMATHFAKRHAEVALSQLSSSKQGIRRFILEELRGSGYEDDEAIRDVAHHEIHHLEDEMPRLHKYGLLFVLFSTYEAVVKRLPGYVGHWTIADVTAGPGDGLIGKVRRFYADHVGVPLFADGVQEKLVRHLHDVRNAIGHATGRIDLLNPKVCARLRERCVSEDGLRVVGGDLQMSSAYVRRAAEGLDQAVRDMIRRLERAYPPPSP